MLRRFVQLLVIVGFATIGLAPHAASATAPSATIQILNQGQLVSGGVVITLDYSCLPPSPGALEVTVGENGVVGVTFTPTATCDDSKHQQSLFVAGPFTPGSAAVRAFVENADVTAVASTDGEVQFK